MTKVKIALLLVIVAGAAYYAGESGINNEQINNIGEDEIVHDMKEYLSENETEGFDFSVRKDCDGNINGLNIKL